MSLGVSVERVRQLVVAGDLPGVRFGNAWAVPRQAVDARRQVSNRKGRPLSPGRVWESISAGRVDLSNVSRYRNRGEAHRYEVGAVDIAFLVGSEQVLVSGPAAADAYGELVQADGNDVYLYVSASVIADLLAVVAAVPDQLGNVIIRVVSDEVWPRVESIESGDRAAVEGLAPRAAVALDLMESGDPRHWIAAEHLIEARV